VATPTSHETPIPLRERKVVHLNTRNGDSPMPDFSEQTTLVLRRALRKTSSSIALPAPAPPSERITAELAAIGASITGEMVALPRTPPATPPQILSHFDPSAAAPDEAQPTWLEHILHEQALLQPTQAYARSAFQPAVDGAHETSYYHAWLEHEAQRRSSRYFKSAWREFIHHVRQRALPAQEEKGFSFATLDPSRSARTTITPGQALAFILVVAALVTGLYLAGPLTLTLLLGGVTFAYLLHLAMTALMAARVVSHTPEERFSAELIQRLDGIEWPLYTVLCPLYKEAGVVPQFVAAMQALDYPQDRLQVLFLTEADDAETRAAIERLRLPAHFEVATVPDGRPRTKPRACNYGLMLARGGFIVIYDAEDKPDPLQLKKAVLAFANHDASLACVQAKLGFYNTRQNLLTRWFAIEYALWFNLTLPGLQWARLSLPLGGTSNHFRADVLRRLGGWDVFNVTEDCDLGLRLAERHLYTTILDSTTLEEANSDVHNWIRQRSRWIKGYMQTYLVHLRRPWNYLLQGRIRELFSLFAVIGATPATILVNPLMWALLGLYIAERHTLAHEFQLLYSAPVFYPAVICLVAGNFLYLYLHLLTCAKSEQYSLLPWALTIPLYWALMSVAAVMALFQLIVKPHHWEKTHHGLHLSRQQAAPMSEQRRASVPAGAATPVGV
jgi:cellulose synthase/poly-beta-1,6-N-acetylglucosamine synthase-like glycosyltransferase